MAQGAAHLSLADLQTRFVISEDAREARHLHTIWLLAKGHTVAEVSEMTAFGVAGSHALLKDRQHWVICGVAMVQRRAS